MRTRPLVRDLRWQTEPAVNYVSARSDGDEMVTKSLMMKGKKQQEAKLRARTCLIQIEMINRTIGNE